MADDLVMRSVYVRNLEDAQLRQLAHDLQATKSDLIRAAISLKLKEWLSDNGRTKVKADLEAGLRDVGSIREIKREKPPSTRAAPAAEQRLKAVKAATKKAPAKAVAG